MKAIYPTLNKDSNSLRYLFAENMLLELTMPLSV